MDSIKLNKVSLTKGFLSNIDIHGVSTHSDPTINLYKFSFLVEGRSIAERFSGADFQFTSTLATGLDDAYKTAEIALVNKAELSQKFSNLDHSINHIYNGLHQVAKEQHLEVVKLAKRFIKQTSFVDIFMRNHLEFQEQTDLATAKHKDAAICIHTPDAKHYTLGSLLYSDYIEVPNTFEPNSYAVVDTPVENYVLKDAKEIYICSLLIQTQGKFKREYEAMSLFTNPQNGKFDLLSKRFHQAQDAFSKLKELWYDREAIYAAYIDLNRPELQQLEVSSALKTDEALVLKTLVTLVKNDPLGYSEQQDTIYWQVVMDLCSYRISAPKAVVLSENTAQNITFDRNNQVILDAATLPDIETLRPIIVNALDNASMHSVIADMRNVPPS